MPSSPDATPNTADGRPRLTRWNARLHYYLGLYFLFFTWLFALTGLLLNHGSWGMPESGPRRTTAKSEHPVTMPANGTPLTDALDLMRQLDVTGEIQWLTTANDATRFAFRVLRPGRQTDVRVDLKTSRATVEATALDAFAVTRALHAFTGVRLNDKRNDRDWIVTTAWAWAMDALALGLLVMVITGIIIWHRQTTNRLPGYLTLTAGLLCCAWFLIGLAHLG